MAYGSECNQFVHYMHYGHHFYHVGDFDPGNPHAEQGIHIPITTDPVHTPPEVCPDMTFSHTWQADLNWQTDTTPQVLSPTLFDLLDGHHV